MYSLYERTKVINESDTDLSCIDLSLVIRHMSEWKE